MTHDHFRRSILVSADAHSAFAALTTGIEHWWTKPDHPIAQVGDRAKFTFPPGKSFWTFEAVRLDAPHRVEMTCVEALHLHEGMPHEIEQEWLGTTVVWTITQDGDQTRIDLEHRGLNPALLCFDVCQAGWDMFFTGSLKAYLDSGVGRPHRAD